MNEAGVPVFIMALKNGGKQFGDDRGTESARWLVFKQELWDQLDGDRAIPFKGQISTLRV